VNFKDGIYSCPECDKTFSTKQSISSHYWRSHTEEGKKLDPNIGYFEKRRKVWNKGLTKETNESIRKAGELYSKKCQTGEIKNYFQYIGNQDQNIVKDIKKTWTPRRKIECIEPTTNRIIFLDSKYELTVVRTLNQNNIIWTRPKPFRWIDSENKSHLYYPDFYLPDYDVYLDPKNWILALKDAEKIKRVSEQNNIRVFILEKNQLSWKFLSRIIGS
jgi:uncharacterized C2H2 Zn-finger protein